MSIRNSWAQVRRLILKLKNLVNGQPAEGELSREVSAHLALLEEDFQRKGMPAVAARMAAKKSFGGIDQAMELQRDERSILWMEDLVQDLRYAVRSLFRNRGFTASTILTLALGIGANVAVFSLVYGVLLRPLPYGNGERLVVLHQQAPRVGSADIPFSVDEIEDYRNGSHTLEQVVEHHSMVFILLTGDRAERVNTAVVSHNFFDALGIQPLLGRSFVANDDLLDSDGVLMLSHAYWQRRFGGDPEVVGRVFEMNDEPHRVIGVLPPFPQYPVESDVYMPVSHCPVRSSPAFITNRQSRMMTAFGVLKPGIPLAEAQADLSIVASQLTQAYPEIYPASNGYSMQLASLSEDLTRNANTTFLLLLSAAAFVLLIACANVANLLLARLLNIQRELSLRMALGAGRGRLIRQLLTESLLLSITGGMIGVAFAPAALSMLTTFAARFTTRAEEVQLDGPVLLFAFVLSVTTGVLFGLGPALVLSRNAIAGIREGSARTTGGRASRIFRGGLVVVQVAVSLVLLTGAGLMIRSFSKMQDVDPGFRPERLLTMRLGWNLETYPSSAELGPLADRLLQAVSTVPGVESVSVATNFPFNPMGIALGPRTVEFEIEGELDPDGLHPTVDFVATGADYFETVGQRLIAGRTITARDTADSLPIVVINQAMADHRWPSESPMGKRVRNSPAAGWREVVGVVQNVREYGLDRPARDQVYVPVAQFSGLSESLILRTQGEPQALVPALREAIASVDPLLAVDQVQTIEYFMEESTSSPRGTTILLSLFAGLALLISCAGIAAVMALSVNERTSELGIRMALGASRESVLLLVTREGFLLALAGVGLGIAGSIVATRMLAGFLYETSPTDVFTFAGTIALFLVMAAVACLIPAWKVTSIDPLHALHRD